MCRDAFGGQEKILGMMSRQGSFGAAQARRGDMYINFAKNLLRMTRFKKGYKLVPISMFHSESDVVCKTCYAIVVHIALNQHALDDKT
jgi:hypothetical protein